MGNNITLRQLEYFVAVAEHGSIAAAAEVVHVSAVAVGAALTELERSFPYPFWCASAQRGCSLRTRGGPRWFRRATFFGG
ncbi:helix-turn-helix domain-containing protein [Corynebacterium endometrii]|uniref:helix-turn-helix domain-containing protein n=1 Tax=Corynebacterium endometrii TaxID=2488819 RepID=UPI0014459044